jgi:glycerol-3-phosphate dehydrogenase (NAD(P)+)
MSNSAPAIGVIGAGAWGTALAQVAASDGSDVLIWAFEEEVVASINEHHANPSFLPDVSLSKTIRATSSMNDLKGCSALLVVTPAQHMRAILSKLPSGQSDLVLCSKGIEASTGELMVDVVHDTHPGRPLAVLSGPTFAKEVARGMPTAITLACEDDAQWERLTPLIARPEFRPYKTDDIVGAEIGGAIKNVLAIACGVTDGLNLGQNARASLISRGFAEMQRFGLAFGARMETLAGLSGLGDLVLTCSSMNSRNFSLGRELADGKTLNQILESRKTVAEGAATAPILLKLGKERGIDLPIVQAVCALLAGEVTAEQVVDELQARPLRKEWRGPIPHIPQLQN